MKTFTMSPSRLSRIKSIVDKIHEKNDTGDILEFGVFEGCSLSEIVFQVRRNGMKNRVFGFDCFQGLPSEDGAWHKGDFTSTLENTISELNSVLGNVNDVVLVPGVYEDVLNDKLKNDLNINKVSLIHVDCDLPQSATTVLEWCKSFIVSGVYIIFDEWPNNEQVSWKKFSTDNQINFKEYETIEGQMLIEVL